MAGIAPRFGRRGVVQRPLAVEREGQGHRVAGLRLLRFQIGREMKDPDGADVAVGPAFQGNVSHLDRQRLGRGVDVLADRLARFVQSGGERPLEARRPEGVGADRLGDERAAELETPVGRFLAGFVGQADFFVVGHEGRSLLVQQREDRLAAEIVDVEARPALVLHRAEPSPPFDLRLQALRQLLVDRPGDLQQRRRRLHARRGFYRRTASAAP